MLEQVWSWDLVASEDPNLMNGILVVGVAGGTHSLLLSCLLLLMPRSMRRMCSFGGKQTLPLLLLGTETTGRSTVQFSRDRSPGRVGRLGIFFFSLVHSTQCSVK